MSRSVTGPEIGGENGVVRHAYAADAPFIGLPRDQLRPIVDGDNRNRCRSDRLFGDTPEENSIDAATTAGPHHDGVDRIRFNMFTDHVRGRAVFDVRLCVCQIVFVGFRSHLLDGLYCRSLKFVS